MNKYRLTHILFIIFFFFIQQSLSAQYNRQTDSLALVALYNSTDGANWTNKWTLTQPMTAWYGVTLTNGRVTCLDLDGTPNCTFAYATGNNLQGSLPTSISDLQELQSLYIGNNKLTGTLPPLNLPKLSNLYLFNNQLSGSIPTLTLPNLVTISLGNNQFSGTIPNFNFPLLQVLNLYTNTFTGTIPNFSSLTNLRFMNISSNQLSGNIPNFNMPNLDSLFLVSNQLSGNIPDFSLPNLKKLYLNNNQLSGNIPNFNLPKLTQIRFHINKLVGSIPSFNLLTDLDTLHLSNNQLNGNIPNFDLQKLKYISLSINQLSGTIPNFNLPNLENLFIYSNNLTGIVPNFNLPKLNLFHFYSNQLDSVPNLNFLPIKADSATLSRGFRAQSNKLTFDDILPNIGFATSATYIYTPQDSIYKDTTFTQTIGTTLTIELGIDGAITDNSYKWFKNGTLYRTTTTNKLPLSNLQLADAGIYTCQVTNPRAPLLTLYSRNITVVVNCTSFVVNVAFTCANGSGTATANVSGSSGYTYQWQNNGSNIVGQTNQTLTITQSGNYKVIVKDVNGCTDSAQGAIFIPLPPTVVATNYCQRATAMPLSATGTNLLWYISNTGGVGSTIAPTPSTNTVGNTDYYVTQTSNGCESSRQALTVTIKSNSTATINPNINQGQTYTVPSGKRSYTTAGTYMDTIASFNGCDSVLTINLTVSIVNPCRQSDSLALVSLYNATGGANWTNKWDLTKPITTWYGITLNASGCVQCLDLDGGTVDCVNLDLNPSGIGLAGTLPDSISQLSALERLVLQGNTGLSGVLPPNFGKLTSLKHFYAYNCRFTRPFPVSFWMLPNIEGIDLNDNPLNMPFPSEFGNFKKLRELHLCSTQLTGTIPTSLGLLDSLANVDICDNNLTGAVPNNLTTRTKMQIFQVESNKLDVLPKFDAARFQTYQPLWIPFFSVQKNRFTFEDILPNMPIINRIAATYATQDSIFKDTAYQNTEGSNLTINLGIDDTVTTNIYKWYKNNVFLSTIVGINKLMFTNLQLTDAGVYWCEVTNPNAPLLTLYSRKITVVVNSSCRSRDSLALIDLYNATGGANWTNKWDLTKPYSTWYGIQVDANGCVINIALSNNNLVGSLVDLKTSNLTALRLDNNKITGNIPNFTLSNLVILYLYENQLTGTIPNFNLPELKDLFLNNNLLSGNIPNFNLPKLGRLYLHQNQLSGTIPNFILPNLIILNLYKNQLTGNVPNFILPSLEFLNVESNLLSGNIPNFMLPSLKSLYLQYNQLISNIPNFNLPNLQDLRLQGNQLTGTIPNLILPNLKYLFLHENQLSGSIPNFNLPNLEALLFNRNKIDSCPNFSVLPIKKDTSFVRGLRSQGNKLTFDDILPNIGFATTATFIYTPQDSIYRDTTLQNTEGSNLTIDLGIDGAITDNSYKWFKNGAVYRTTTTNKLLLSNVQLTDAGVYTCEVTNPRALLLTLYSRKITVVVNSSCRSRDSLALVDLYNATGGPNWTNKWDLSKSIDTWYGITINNNGCVITVNLGLNRLVGSLPNLNMPDLRGLSLYSNQLSGSLPSLNLLTSLGSLDISANKFNGSIPNFNFNNLSILNIGSNQLSGTIPNFSMPNLISLQLGANQLTGNIPNFNLPKLQTLHLFDNQLIGNIPNFNLTILQSLALSNNQLSGNIPNFNLPSITHLQLNTNQLTGNIPNFNLPNLVNLYLYSNQLTGSIPNFSLPKLELLFLYSNQLSGAVSNLNLPKIERLWIYDNKIDSVSNISLLPFKPDSLIVLKGLRSQGNKLTFDDILPNIGFATSATYIYTPQDSIYKDTTITLTTGCDLTVNLNIDGAITDNVYKWYQGTNFKYSNNSNKLILRGVQASDAGVYTCQVTNPRAPLLTLNSRKITLKVNVVTPTTQNKAICQGQSYVLPSGKIVSTANTYRDTLKSINGCDSAIIVTNLSINSIITNLLSKSICSGQTYTLPKGQIVSTAGTYRDTLKSVGGCDSVVVTTLSVNSRINTPLSRSICQGQTYTLPKGQVVSTAGTYRDTLKSVGGCDSVVVTTLSVNSTISTSLNRSICQGQTYTLPKGRIVSAAGIYRDTLKTSGGCDSVVVTTLSFNSKITVSLSKNICQGQTYPLSKGRIVSTSGIYVDTLKTVGGCDSIIIITLNVNPAISISISKSICQRQTYILPKGRIVSVAGVYRDTLKNATGCDSIIVTTLSITPPAIEKVTQRTCSGVNYRLPNGSIATKGGIYRDTLRSSSGCDTILEITLIVDTVKIIKDDTLCAGQKYRLPSGKEVTELTTHKDIVKRQGQCDTIYFITLTEGCLTRLKIFNGLTPDGAFNRNFVVEGIDDYPEAKLFIYTRTNALIFQSKGSYKNDWNGTDQNGTPLPADTYYYILDLGVPNQKPLQGYILLAR